MNYCLNFVSYKSFYCFEKFFSIQILQRLAIFRTLALRESAKTTFSQRGKLQKNIEAIEAERSSMPTQLLNHQRGIFPSSSNKSTHKKSSLSKSIMAIAPKSKKSLIESMIDDKSKCKG